MKGQITAYFENIGYAIFYIGDKEDITEGSRQLIPFSDNRDEVFGYDYYITAEGHYIAVPNKYNGLFD